MPLGWVQVWEEVTGRSWGSPCCRSCSQREEGMFWCSPSLIASRLNKLLLLPTKFVKLLTACATKFFLRFLFVWLNLHNHDLRNQSWFSKLTHPARKSSLSWSSCVDSGVSLSLGAQEHSRLKSMRRMDQTDLTPFIDHNFWNNSFTFCQANFLPDRSGNHPLPLS